jgi:hypothetical protein
MNNVQFILGVIKFDPQLATSQQLEVHATHTKAASVVPPEDGRLTPKTCRGLRHNKVIVKATVYQVGYVIVIHDTWSTKYKKLKIHSKHSQALYPSNRHNDLEGKTRM